MNNLRLFRYLPSQFDPLSKMIDLRFVSEQSTWQAVLVGFAFLLAGLCCRPVNGELILLDQELDAFAVSTDPNQDLGGPNVDVGQFALQTFTVGLDGFLAALAVQVQQGAEEIPTSDLVLTIRRVITSGPLVGAPDRQSNLGTVSLPVGSFPAFDSFRSAPFTSFDVRSLNIRVRQNDVLAFELSSSTDTDNSFFAWDSQTDDYDRGSEYIFDPDDNSFASIGRDLGFRTFVAVPEPGGAALVTMGSLLVIFHNRRRRET